LNSHSLSFVPSADFREPSLEEGVSARATYSRRTKKTEKAGIAAIYDDSGIELGSAPLQPLRAQTRPGEADRHHCIEKTFTDM